MYVQAQAGRKIAAVTSQDTCLFRIDDAFAIEAYCQNEMLRMLQPYTLCQVFVMLFVTSVCFFPGNLPQHIQKSTRRFLQ